VVDSAKSAELSTEFPDFGYSVEGTQKERQKKKPSAKMAAQAIAKTVYKYVVELPEEERKKEIAAFAL
jgi:hypothetical protein